MKIISKKHVKQNKAKVKILSNNKVSSHFEEIKTNFALYIALLSKHLQIFL